MREAGSEVCCADAFEDGETELYAKGCLLVVSRSWKIQGNRLSPTTSGNEPSPSSIRILAQWNSHQPSIHTIGIYDNKFVLFWTTEFFVITYGSNRKLLQPLCKDSLEDLET